MMKTARTTGDTTSPTYGANMAPSDTYLTTKAGLNVKSNGQPEIWDRVGTPYGLSGLLYCNVAASTAVSNTTTETLFNEYATIPANTLVAGSKVRIRFQGIATATNSTDTLTIKLYWGGLSGTALISMSATDVADNNVFQGEYEIIIRTAGASGTMVGCGTYKSVPAAEGTMTIKDDILASTAVDTTAAIVVGVGATWSVASASNSCRLDVMIVEAAVTGS